MTEYVKKFNIGGREISLQTYDDSAIRQDINSEITNRTNADSELQTNIDNEANTRERNDSELQQAINTQAGRIDNAYNVSYDAVSETIKFASIL